MRDLSLVTGGAGFVGSNLVRGLLDRGSDVRVLDDLSTGRRGNLEDVRDHVDLIEGDIRDVETVRRAMRGVRVVFHQAAIPSVARSVRNPLASHEANATGTLHVLVAAREAGADRVVYASSSSIYGDAPRLPVTEDVAAEPLSPYGAAKLAGERYVGAFHATYGMATLSLRYFNVFGPRQDPRSEYAAVVPRFVTATLEGRPPRIFGDGEQSRDFVHVSDVVTANLLAAEAPEAAWGRAFNVACDDRHSVKDLLVAIRSFVPGDHPEPVYDPPRPGEVLDSQADIALAREVLGYAPAHPFEEGVRATVEWFRSAGG